MDDLLKEMERGDRYTLDEWLFDRYGVVSVRDLDDPPEFLSPRDYGLRRNIQPQRVYYYIRTGKIVSIDCLCGRHVIDERQADEVFGLIPKEQQHADD